MTFEDIDARINASIDDVASKLPPAGTFERFLHELTPDDTASSVTPQHSNRSEIEGE